MGDIGNGCFIVVMYGFVEFMIYFNGVLIMVVGKFNGSCVGKVGEVDYVFLLVIVD